MLAALAGAAATRQRASALPASGAGAAGHEARATRAAAGTPTRVAAGHHGAEHGLCRRCVPGLRGDGRRRTAAGLSRGTGVRGGRDRLGGLRDASAGLVDRLAASLTRVSDEGETTRGPSRVGQSSGSRQLVRIGTRGAATTARTSISAIAAGSSRSAGATVRASDVELSVDLAPERPGGWCSATRCWSRRARSATASSTATSSTSSASARSARRARPSGRASAIRRRA